MQDPNTKPVDFLICGTQKGGTSALDAYCRLHDALHMADIKEVHFFDDDDAFATAVPDYAAYHAHFAEHQAGKLRGESTPVYMYWPGAPARIHAYNPLIRLIVLLRDPAQRAYSHWQMETRRGLETLPFGKAVRTEEERLRHADADHWRVWSYVDRGRYLRQLETLWSLFGKSRVLVLRSDDLRTCLPETLDRVSAFLGIAPFPALQAQAVNAQHYDSVMPAEDRDYLRSVFADEISALERALGWNLDAWRSHG